MTPRTPSTTKADGAGATLTGEVFDIQKFSIHDGPGIRTTVFLKGCPLRCLWCHNPESLSIRPDLSFDPRRCIGCGACFKACPAGVHRMEDGKRVLARESCRLCGACAETCYAQALELIGRPMTVASVMEKVLQDLPFYRDSGGGMTLSGGEPALQPDFAIALLKDAARHRIHTAVETSGFCDPAILERMQPLCNLFLYDVKADPEHHEELIGVPFDRIGKNLRMLHAAGARIWLRLPTIPGLTDTDARFRHVAALVKELPRIEAVEMIPYHPLGRGKNERMGLTDRLPQGIETPTPETVAEWLARLATLGVKARTPGS